jgi:hypothetical protein
VEFARPRFGRKNFSGKNEKPDNFSVVVDAIVDDGPVDIIVAGTGGIAAVASGRIEIADDVSTGMIRAGFLINDKNKC